MIEEQRQVSQLVVNHGLGAVEASLLGARGPDGDVQGCSFVA